MALARPALKRGPLSSADLRLLSTVRSITTTLEQEGKALRNVQRQALKDVVDNYERYR